MLEYHTNALNTVLLALRDSAVLSAAVRYLRSKAQTINAELGDTVLAEIPAFSVSRNPAILPDLARHGPEHTEEILRLLEGGAVGDFEFVRAHARRRAEHRFPLEATLHAYRCGHRVFSRWVREATLVALDESAQAETMVGAVADFTLEYTDAISTIAANTYVAQTRLLAAVAGDQRAELLSILLDGYDEADGRVAKILNKAGYLDRRLSFCVALAQSVESSEMLNPARARRVAESIEAELEGSGTRRLIDLRDNQVIIIFSSPRRDSGWSAPNAKLATKVAAELSLVGNAVLIGMSNDVPSTSQIPDAYRQASLALELARVSDRVVQFSTIPARRLLLHLAGEELQPVLPSWSNELFAVDHKLRGVLIATMRAYADANMNVLKAAEHLSIHPNTIYSRFQKIMDITGLDAKSYHMLGELLLVVDCRDCG